MVFVLGSIILCCLLLDLLGQSAIESVPVKLLELLIELVPLVLALIAINLRLLELILNEVVTDFVLQGLTVLPRQEVFDLLRCPRIVRLRFYLVLIVPLLHRVLRETRERLLVLDVVSSLLRG